MPDMHVVIPEKSPLMPLLERRAVKRGFAEGGRKVDRSKLRRKLPELARVLITERLAELERSDPLETAPAAPFPD